MACTIYPVVAELDVFERALDYMLANRSKAQQENLQLNPNSPMGVSLPWLALFFAVLASGAQCSNISAKERELTSQVYSEYHVSTSKDAVNLMKSSLLLLSSTPYGQLLNSP